MSADGENTMSSTENMKPGLKKRNKESKEGKCVNGKMMSGTKVKWNRVNKEDNMQCLDGEGLLDEVEKPTSNAV